ncbi:MAG: type II toxin-antitoxin system HipA family toxin [Bifidobacteriaceae bacterium]|nr:type II toxin-antitoxin system HipA family toxin [Bifidobacteriaceae bacterium]
MRRLTAYLDGIRTGWFTQLDTGRVIFEVDMQWAEGSGAMELSLSLPKSKGRHDGPAPVNYLAGLLPDDPDVVRRWAGRFGVSAASPMALLENVGLDAAGGVQLSTEDGAVLDAPRDWAPLTEEEIGRHLAELRGDRTGWMFPRQQPQSFSLAGAQGKFALTDAHGGWALPLGAEPTTHILKPGATGFSSQALTEHLTMRAAGLMGLRVADTRMAWFAGEPAIVAARYDRAQANGMVRRLHQEDFVQAFGLPPDLKYQSDGGPGMTRVVDILRASLRAGDADAAVWEFTLLCAFNWVALATDGHAKNFSLLHSPDGPSLAPGYDMASALPYPDLADQWTARLAMSVGGNYRDRDIAARHWRREATAAGIDPDSFAERLRGLVATFPDAASQAARETGLAGGEALFAGEFVDLAARRSRTLQDRLSVP